MVLVLLEVLQLLWQELGEHFVVLGILRIHLSKDQGVDCFGTDPAALARRSYLQAPFVHLDGAVLVCCLDAMADHSLYAERFRIIAFAIGNFILHI